MNWRRLILVDVLINHQRVSPSSCSCGWSVLGAFHAEHVADVYEAALQAAGIEVT